MTQDFRTEKDILGEKQIPARAYWGIHTQRALENFRLSPHRVNARLIRAIAMVKKAACLTNRELGYLDAERASVLEKSCDEVIAGGMADQFPLDALQGGAGTSTNMNVNEVLANRSLELLGYSRGEYDRMHPIEQVNLHQSTNDVYPTALKVAAINAVREMSAGVARLQGAFQKKEKEFSPVVKIGRTEMREAVPVTLGAEFGAYAEAFSRDRWRISKAEERLRVVNIGATAAGTGLGAPREYIFLVIEKLREVTGLGVSRGENLMDATAAADVFVEVGGILNAHAASLLKVCNDLRLMSLLGEIALPAMQAGSSIMAGKINPVIPEAIIQCCHEVIASQHMVAVAAGSGTLEINEFMPLISHAFLSSIDLLMNADAALVEHTSGITADPVRCREYFDRSPTLLTAFLPLVGYEMTQQMHEELIASGRKNVREFLAEKLGADTVERVLSAQNLLSLGYTKNGTRA